MSLTHSKGEEHAGLQVEMALRPSCLLDTLIRSTNQDWTTRKEEQNARLVQKSGKMKFSGSGLPCLVRERWHTVMKRKIYVKRYVVRILLFILALIPFL